MKDKECPVCQRLWPSNCEQSDNIRKAGMCIVCDIGKQRQLINDVMNAGQNINDLSPYPIPKDVE